MQALNPTRFLAPAKIRYFPDKLLGIKDGRQWMAVHFDQKLRTTSSSVQPDVPMEVHVPYALNDVNDPTHWRPRAKAMRSTAEKTGDLTYDWLQVMLSTPR
jgi:hypothetical protein